MTRRLACLLCLGLLVAAQGLPLRAQPSAVPQQGPTRMLLLLDCSHSMWDTWRSGAKIKVTQQVLLSFLDSVARRNDVEVALRVFGHLNKDAFGTRLEVPFSPDNTYQLQSKIKTLVPNGGCTVEAALTDALTDFPATPLSRNIIVVITDGEGGRDNEICQVSRQVQLSGVVVQTFVVGIGTGAFHHMTCDYLPVSDEENYTSLLLDILRLAGRKSQVVLRVEDADGSLFETEHPVVFSDHRTGVAQLTTLYAVDPSLRPDTLLLDPLVSYDVNLFTRPPLVLRNVSFRDTSVATLRLVANEGNLRVRYRGRVAPGQALPDVLVKPAGTANTAGTQPVGETERYLEGRYDIEVLTLPATRFSGVTIRRDTQTDLEIPLPGQLVLTKPRGITTGAIFQLRDGKPLYVATLSPSRAGERLMLQPGTYELVLHPQGATAYADVITRRFQIESNHVTKLNL